MLTGQSNTATVSRGDRAPDTAPEWTPPPSAMPDDQMTPDAPFPHLFSPLTSATVDPPNRIVSSGHDTVMADDGQITDRLIAYHGARAARRRRSDHGPGGRDPRDRPLHQPRHDGDRRLVHPRLPRAGGGGQAARHRAVRAALPPRAGGHGPGRRHADGGRRPVGGADRAVPGHAARRSGWPKSARSPTATVRAPPGCQRPAWTASRSSPATATSRRSSSTRPPTCATTSTAARPRTGSGSCARPSTRSGGTAGPTSWRVCGSRSTSGTHRGCRPTSRSPPAWRWPRRVSRDYLSVTTGTSASLAGSDHIAPDMTNANGYVAPLSGEAARGGGRARPRRRADQPAAGGGADHRGRAGRRRA